MYRTFILTFALLTVALFCVSLPACTVVHTAHHAAPPPPPPEYDEYESDYVEYVEYSDFDELSPYGNWIELPPFGVVWQPSVVRGWSPYLHGHWVWTEWEWMWVSYEPFGWATYHYGYWYYDPGWGWVWIPGDEWSPVRVQWIWMDDYVCWAPMSPPGYVIADPWIAHTPHLWVVVHFRHFAHQDLHRYTVTLPSSHGTYKTAYKRRAPTVNVVERHIGRPVRRVDVKIKDHRVGGKAYKKVVLPPSHRETVESYKPQTKKKVFKKDVKDPPSRPKTYKSKTKKTSKPSVDKKPAPKKQKTKEPAKTKKSKSSKKGKG